MTQDDGAYELRPEPDRPRAPSTAGAAPKPGEPGWVPPVPIIERAEESAVTPEEIEAARNAADIEQHKVTAALGYLFFVIPLIAAPNSRFTRYHANQGLLLFILLFVIVILVALLRGGAWLANLALAGRIELLAMFFGCGFYLLQIAMLVGWLALLVVGTLHAMNGLMEPLPVIGHWTLVHPQDTPQARGAAPSEPLKSADPVQTREENKP